MATLLGVFAHPDDETFICGGTFAKCHGEGHRTVLVCATKGEMGRRLGNPAIATRETIAQVREKELQDACQALSIDVLYFLGLRDKTLEIQDGEQLKQRVLAHMERERPDTIITFSEQFGGHPDHCAIGAATTRAFVEYRQHHKHVRLFFVAWQGTQTQLNDFGIPSQAWLQVDVSAQFAEKLAAFRAHRTQSEVNAWVWDSQAAKRRLSLTEYFVPYATNFGQEALFAK